MKPILLAAFAAVFLFSGLTPALAQRGDVLVQEACGCPARTSTSSTTPRTAATGP